MTDEGITDLELVSNLNEQFSKIGVSLTDSSGQMRSSYDILHDLSNIWGTLDKNTKIYIAELVAGKNQVDVFNALLSNFTSAVSANETAMNSAGSAARENAAYMESLEAKTSALKQSFQELSTSLIDNDLVKIILDMANGLLEIANTPIGKFALVATGITAVVIAVASLARVIPIVQSFNTVFIKTATTLVAGTLPMNAAIIGTIAGISALIALFPTLKSWYDNIQEPLTGYTSKLEDNKKRLEEINDLPWYEKTDAILAEAEALKTENKELEDLIKNRQELINKADAYGKVKQYQGNYKPDYASKNNAKYTVTLGGVRYADVNSLDEAYKKLNVTQQEFIDQGYELVSLQSSVDDKYKAVVEDQQALISKMSQGKELSTDEQKRFQENSQILQQMASDYKNATEQGVELDKETQQFVQTVNSLDEATQNLTKSQNDQADANGELSGKIKITKEQYADMIAKYPELNKQINILSGNYYVNQEAIESLALAGDKWARGFIENQIQATKAQSKEALKRINEAYQEAQALARIYSTSTLGGEDLEKYLDAQKRSTAAYNEWKLLNSKIKDYEADVTEWKAQDKANATKAKSSTTKTDPIEEQSKLFKDQITVLEDRLSILQKSNATQEEQVAQMKKIQDALHEQANWYRNKGLDENSQYLSDLGNQWWDYQNKVQSVYDAIAEAAEEERQKELEAQRTQLESRQSAYEALFSYMSNNIDKEISALQEERTDEEEYWDAKIQALKDENDEIERQIELETLQSNLAKANQSQVMVFKDGRFQYIKNIDEISQAQTALESYQREQALADETARLETLKDKALASIDKQIKGWEDYKDEWSSVVSDYSNNQDKLLIEQQLGIKLEGDNWKERLDNLSSYVKRYNSIMSQLSSMSASSNSSTSTSTSKSGSSSSGGSLASNIVKTVSNVIGSISKAVSNAGTTTSSSDRVSQDIRKHATGTLSADGGMALVGEEGPELRVLNQGDGIIPSDITKNLMALGSNPYAVMGNAYRNLAGKNGGNTTYGFSIDKIELPNVNDPPSFVEGLKNYAYQYTTQRK